jgi:RNA polymerase sigma-54 factor
MRLSLGLEQKLVQKQVLAPRMIQSMEILQLPILALQDRIEEELAENPMLEAREQDPTLPDEAGERENPDAPTAEEKELVVDEKNDNSEDFERLLEMDREFPDHFDDAPRRSAGSLDEASQRKHDAMANIAARSVTLQDYLETQLGELDLDDAVCLTAERIITSLDSNGYLTSSLEDVLPPGSDATVLSVAERALAVIQSLDPAGVGARSLRECLLLQLRPDMPMYSEVKTLISDHLEDLHHNRLPAIQRKTGFSIERIQRAWEELRKLNPKPGAAFNQLSAPTVTPDLFVDQLEDGSYKVRLEEGYTPTLRISKYYRQRLLSGKATPEEREFIKRKINAAQWLIESIEQRRSTLTRVAQAIIDHQTRFLNEGPEAIEPLKMQQIADKVGVHVTTVSRAVGDKWIQTPRGIYPLKRFFVGGTKSDDGEDVAWDAIRIKLQELIDKEDKSNPYSDDELVRELHKHGLRAARRTITKYRKKMDIPSSRQRRDWSKMPATPPPGDGAETNGRER